MEDFHKPFARPGVSVLPLGVGDAFSALHYPTCMLVSRLDGPAWDDQMILIDCPHGLRKMMREADRGRFNNLDLHRVRTIILTHLHADHVSGLQALAAFFAVTGQLPDRRPRLVALPEVLEGVPALLEPIANLGTMKDFFDVFPLGDGRPSSFAEFGMGETAINIRFHRTKHSVPTAAVRVSVGKKTLAYSSDTSFDRTLWAWLWNGDPQLVVHEIGHGEVHTNPEDLYQRLEHDCPTADGFDERVFRMRRRLRLTHYPDDLVPVLESRARNDLWGPHLLREGQLEVL